MNSLKIAILAIALITVVGTASSTTLQNIEEIQPVGDQAITITGEIDLGNNGLANVGSFGSCGANEFINGDGNCAQDDYSPDTTIADDQQLSISGDTISLDNGGSVTVPSGDASTKCSGQYTFLAGDNDCEDFTTNTDSFINGDLLTDSLDGTEIQTDSLAGDDLSSNGDQLSLSNSVDVSTTLIIPVK